MTVAASPGDGCCCGGTPGLSHACPRGTRGEAFTVPVTAPTLGAWVLQGVRVEVPSPAITHLVVPTTHR